MLLVLKRQKLMLQKGNLTFYFQTKATSIYGEVLEDYIGKKQLKSCRNVFTINIIEMEEPLHGFSASSLQNFFERLFSCKCCKTQHLSISFKCNSICTERRRSTLLLLYVDTTKYIETQGNTCEMDLSLSARIYG